MWQPYFDGRKKRVHPAGFVIIVPEEHQPGTPFCCPVCELVMSTADDSRYYKELSCCYACGLKWADANKSAWNDGWRPLASEIEAEVEARLRIPLTVNLAAFES